MTAEMYYGAKSSAMSARNRRYKTDAELTPEEKAAHDALLLKVKEQTEKVTKDLNDKIVALEASKTADKAEIKSLKEAQAALEAKKIDLKSVEEFKTLALEMAELAIKVKAMNEAPKNDAKKASLKAVFVDTIKKNKEAIIKSMKAEKPFEIELKYPETITEDNTILDGDTFQSLTQNTGIFSGIRRRIVKYLENVSTGSITNRFALWFEEVSADGKPYFIHEKDEKRKEGFKFVEKTEPVKKVAVRAKMSMEWLEDLGQFYNFLVNKLMKSMDIEIEDQLLNGAGGTGSDEPLGIYNTSVAFTGGSGAGTVTRPNVADVIRAVALQVEEAFGMANAIIVHPSALFQLDTIKTVDGLYTRPFWANDNLIAGLKIISSLAVGADEFIGGDMSVINVLFRNAMTIRIGETGDDFAENKKSIILEQRLVQFVSANDYAQLVYGEFSTAEGLLESGS